ncbi:class I SAM-dependent methyltransferase [Anaerolineae bacterium CFX7]|nr:class I SAM-dependent methyltransferase [Anaerolineae bacterium CFX7]
MASGTILSDSYKGSKSAEYFRCDREEMLDYVPAISRTVLDVGCGAGNFGRSLKERCNCEVWGVEMEAHPAQEAARYLDRVLVGAFPNVELPAGYFDCIVFNDVLEHMVDPWEALCRAKEYLTPNGVIAASVPNIRYVTTVYRLLVHGEWNYTEYGILDKTHLRFFTKKSMRALFEETGYEVFRIEGIYPNQRWQVKMLAFFWPGFVNEAKYVDYAISARPRQAEKLGVV